MANSLINSFKTKCSRAWFVSFIMLGVKDVFTFHDDYTIVKTERVRKINYSLKHYFDIFGRRKATIVSMVTAIT